MCALCDAMPNTHSVHSMSCVLFECIPKRRWVMQYDTRYYRNYLYHIINTVRDLISTQHPLIPLIKPESMDSDSDIEIISCKIPSSNSSQIRPQSQPTERMIQTDNARVNADTVTNNSQSTDAMPVNTQYDDASLSCPQCYKAFENQALLCAHLIASMQNKGCNTDSTSSQASVPSIPSPSLSLSHINVCDPMLSQQSHVSVVSNNEDTQMDLNTNQIAEEMNNDAYLKYLWFP
eukprot:105439_1